MNSVKLTNYCLSATLFILIFLFFVETLQAQRNVSYPQLAKGTQQNLSSFDQIILPGDSDSTITFATVYNIPYSSLSFKKKDNAKENSQFQGTSELSMEIFESDESTLQKDNKEPSIEGLQPIERSLSSDTAFAKSYEQSKSDKRFLSGYLKVALSPGIYSYILQIKQGAEIKNRTSRVRTVRLNSYQDKKSGNVIFGKALLENSKTPQLKLSKLGKNVEYAQDFYALAYIPEFTQASDYTLEITRLDKTKDDTNRVNTVYSKKLSPDNIRENIVPRLAPANDGRTHLNLTSSTDGFAYALIELPGSQLPNAMYRLTVAKETDKKTVAGTTFKTIWINIPTSLLNLDVAIDMLSYIADDETVDKLSRGTRKEREKKFQSYWEKRDPTPNTEFNELMAEYYKRIDYAYENFTTESTLGYNNDRGKVYIKFGQPEDITRKYPADDATTEIWSYPSRKFIFKATSGFGDFRLVSNESK